MLEIVKNFIIRHKSKTNILLHVIGIPLVLLGIVQLFMAKWGIGAINFLLGYTLQYIGHVHFEKNELGEIRLFRKLIKKLIKDNDAQ